MLQGANKYKDHPCSCTETHSHTDAQCTQLSHGAIWGQATSSQKAGRRDRTVSAVYFYHIVLLTDVLALFIGAHAVKWQPRRDIRTVWPHSWTGGELMPFDGMRGKCCVSASLSPVLKPTSWLELTVGQESESLLFFSGLLCLSNNFSMCGETASGQQCA